MKLTHMLGDVFSAIATKVGLPAYVARLTACTYSGWTNAYRPAITAFSKDAPNCSRRVCIYSAKLGRDIHLLSTPEQYAALLALYHPRLFALHEQIVLSPRPDFHPLSGHPDTRGLDLPPFRGTVEVAERLGQLRLHPTTVIDDPDDPTAVLRVPVPLLGDLLLFVRDENDVPFCINWTVKKDEDGFKRGLGLQRSQRREELRQQRLAFRHQLEELYYEDAGIRTVRVTQDKIDTDVANNLRHLYGYNHHAVKVSSKTRHAIEARLQSLIGSNTSPLNAAATLMQEFSCDCHDVRAILYQGVWNRRLRVDLFTPVLFDRPLTPESRDILDVYGDWFRRAA